jgi:CRISPR-associated protein Cas2
MKGYGEPVQYSVFVCDLNDKEIILMKEDLGNVLNLAEDRILIINTGSADKSNEHIFTMGMQLEIQKKASIVI